MSYILMFNSDAEKEFNIAYEWYEEQREGLGERFLNETEKLLQKIIDNPYSYHFSKKDYRESSIKDFPFTIVYTVDEKKKTIYISSIFHSSRNPKGKYRK